MLVSRRFRNAETFFLSIALFKCAPSMRKFCEREESALSRILGSLFSSAR